MKIAKILVQGIVQGVGFRPTVYRIATELNLKGTVKNLGNIVEIIIEGDEATINNFIKILKDKKPPIAIINSINVQWVDDTSEFKDSLDNNINIFDLKNKNPNNYELSNYDFKDFKILESSDNFSGTSVIPPDLAICDSCLEEIKNPKNRRYNYSFTACTDCGPRFTVIESVPYDRDNTTMKNFQFCEKCLKEYNNPENRRYHAEASCCSDCGPSLSLLSSKNKKLNSENPIKDAVKLLDKGKILAMKGIGGTHLVANVTDQKAVKKLRKRLNRPNQPFAVMSPNLDDVKSFAEMSTSESGSLTSRQRPIVILKKNKDYFFNDFVAPKLHNIGVMLPYSPLHHLLFDYTDEIAYIMTSANLPGEPMMVNNKEILGNLKGIADYFLLHNRKILNRCDDSVIRFRNNELAFIRRSRGYTPEPYDLSKLGKVNNDFNILALGPELDVTFTLEKEGLAYVSQHIGNTNKFRTYNFLQEAIEYMMNITKTKTIDLIACDMHPQFFTTKLAEELTEKYKCDILPVQHHHAHGGVLAIDNSLDELIYIAADGVGYGEDGTAWGGEILYTDVKSYERLGSLIPQKMPGGDISTTYPVRMLSSILKNSYEKKDDEEKLRHLLKEKYVKYFQYGEVEIDSVLKQIESSLNVGITTSAGRILDSISVALGICGKRTYEGECSMKLESAAYKATGDLTIPYEIKKVEGRPVLDTNLILKDIIEKIKKGEPKKEIAAAGQKALSYGLGELAVMAADKKRIDVIGATGGVFYNEAITLATKEYVEESGFKFIQHKNSCAGDGSISLGQAAIGYKILNEL